jgi:hypothetical protein
LTESLPYAQVAALAVIAFAGALVFGVAGFGVALVTIPLATHLLPLKFALALFALVDLACAAAVGFEKPKNAVRSEWKRLVPAIVVGTVCGATLLVNLPRQAGMLLLGLFILSYCAYSLLRHESTKTVSEHWAWLAGVAGGLSSTLFGAGGPPYVIYLSQRGLTKEQFRATLGLTTLTSISLRVIAFVLTGLLLDAQVWLTAMAAVPAALLGIYVSRKIFRRISREILMRAVMLLLLGSGSSLVYRALTAF